MARLKISSRFPPFAISALFLIVALGLNSSFAQEREVDSKVLPPGISLDHEIISGGVDRYSVHLQKDEFFQVRVVQKGVDVALKFFDTSSGKVLATMDSTSLGGSETLSYMATNEGSYVLEVVALEEKSSVGSYTIQRSASRMGTAQDRLRVQAERVFVEGMEAGQTQGQAATAQRKLKAALRGWKELHDDEMVAITARQIGMLEMIQTKRDLRPLKIGESIERQFGSDEAHFYTLELSKGQVLHLDVQAKGVSVALALGRKRSAEIIGESSSGVSYTREALTYIVEESGAYIVLITHVPNRKSTGTYKLLANVKTSADETDRERVLAESLYSKSVQLLNQDNKDNLSDALATLASSRKLWEKLDEKYWEARCLTLVGTTNIRLDEPAKALEALQDALPIWREINDKSGESLVLANLANIYLDKEPRRAIQTITQAIDLVREIGDRQSEATYLQAVARMYGKVGEREKGTVYWFAGQLHGSTQDFPGQLTEIGMTKKEFGDIRIAKEFLELALVYSASYEHSRQRAGTLRYLADIYLSLGRTSEALEAANSAADLSRENGDGRGLAFSLGYLSEVRLQMGEPGKALQLANQASGLVGRQKYTKILLWTGTAHNAAGLPKQALTFLNEAFLLTKRSVDYSDEARALNGLMDTWQALGNSRLAIFYGKQAVNVLQTQRSTLRGFDQLDTRSKNPDEASLLEEPDEESSDENGLRQVLRVYGDRNAQHLFIKSNEQIYKKLAELLIQNNRKAEAAEVLIALQDQRALDFDPGNSTEPKPLSMTAREMSATARYAQMSEELTQVKMKLHQWAEEHEEDTVSLKFIPKKGTGLTKEEERKEDEITIKQLDQGMSKFADVVREIETDFKRPVTAADTPPEIKVLQDLQETLDLITRKTNQKTVAVYQLVGKTIFSTIVVTSNDIFSVSSEVTADKVNQRAVELWALLQSDDYNPALLSNALYNVVFKPIESKLPKDTQTLLWSLDDNLRYLPMAALYDGRHYLVERYNHVLLSRMNREGLIQRPRSPQTGYGFATTKQQRVELLEKPIQFEPLESAQDEMQIFRTLMNPHGLIDGDTFSDSEFNINSFIAKARQGRSVVHISSHFYFYPGNEYRSFLLFGNGSVLTLSQMKQEPGLFKDVDLLTLSACNTAAQVPDGDGWEIDGFAELAQRLGARSVLASLWEVRDKSTALLMKGFYQNWQSSKLNKAEGLRRSQLDLLQGRIKPSQDPRQSKKQTPIRGGATSIQDIVVEQRYLVPYLEDRLTKPFAHPYYWAPFVIFGNWR